MKDSIRVKKKNNNLLQKLKLMKIDRNSKCFFFARKKNSIKKNQGSIKRFSKSVKIEIFHVVPPCSKKRPGKH
jgi:hypothetical protein